MYACMYIYIYNIYIYIYIYICPPRPAVFMSLLFHYTNEYNILQAITLMLSLIGMYYSNKLICDDIDLIVIIFLLPSISATYFLLFHYYFSLLLGNS